MPSIVADAPTVSLSCELNEQCLSLLWKLTFSAVANNFWGKDDAGVQPLLERMQNAKTTCDELKNFYNSQSPNARTHSSH